MIFLILPFLQTPWSSPPGLVLGTVPDDRGVDAGAVRLFERSLCNARFCLPKNEHCTASDVCEINSWSSYAMAGACLTVHRSRLASFWKDFGRFAGEKVLFWCWHGHPKVPDIDTLLERALIKYIQGLIFILLLLHILLCSASPDSCSYKYIFSRLSIYTSL